MPDPVAGVFHDAVALSRLIESVSDCCEYQRGQCTYLAASERFFDHIGETCQATQRFLQDQTALIQKYPHWAQQLRQGFVQIKKFWSEIHKYVKPAAEADTLSIPLALIPYAESKMACIPQVSDSRIVLFLSADLNYFQYRGEYLSGLTEDLRSVVGRAPVFPRGLALIGMPYSQSSRLLSNLLIFHELGHYAFEELDLSRRLSSEVQAALLTEMPAKMKKDAETVKWFRGHLQRWSEEIYCDLFAISLIGPAFSFAAMELFDVIGLLERTQCSIFTSSHPAEACRFKEHVRKLKELGWWSLVGTLNAEPISKMEELAGIAETTYRVRIGGDIVKVPWLLRAFRKVRESIRDLVNDSAPGSDGMVASFKQWNAQIQKCLAAGIVPSALQKRGESISPEAILNAASCFCLENLDKLVANVEKKRVSRIPDRSELAQRLDLWTMKALEDLALMP